MILRFTVFLKWQALVEMCDLEIAKQMVDYHSRVLARVRTHVVHIQFSNHEHLRVEQRVSGFYLNSLDVRYLEFVYETGNPYIVDVGFGSNTINDAKERNLLMSLSY